MAPAPSRNIAEVFLASASHEMEIEPDNASSDRPAFDPLRFATIQRSFIFHPELVSAMKLLLTRLSAIAQFQSPRHLEELQLSDETNKCVSVLKNPANGNLVYLIGTFGFSKASADDVKSLIEAVHPDALALEVGASKRCFSATSLVDV